jgi:hypothetical protein
MTTRIKFRARAAFVQLHQPKAFGDSAERFSCSFLFEPGSEADKIVRDGITAEAAAKWGAKAPAIVKSAYASDANCLHNGDTKAQYTGFEGMMFVSAGQTADKGRPDVRNAKGQPVAPGEAGYPYSGCYVVAIVDLWAQDNQYGKKVNASIAAVQFWKDGEAFSGAATPVSDDEFEDLSSEDYA